MRVTRHFSHLTRSRFHHFCVTREPDTNGPININKRSCFIAREKSKARPLNPLTPSQRSLSLEFDSRRFITCSWRRFKTRVSLHLPRENSKYIVDLVVQRFYTKHASSIFFAQYTKQIIRRTIKSVGATR